MSIVTRTLGDIVKVMVSYAFFIPPTSERNYEVRRIDSRTFSVTGSYNYDDLFGAMRGPISLGEHTDIVDVMGAIDYDSRNGLMPQNFILKCMQKVHIQGDISEGQIAQVHEWIVQGNKPYSP